ncbi:MAG: Crp/Fnr family transcriptional regulator [Bacteroidota bacterium]
MNPHLKAYIERYVYLEPAEYEVLVGYFEEKRFKKKALLLESGQVCRYNYFLLQGLVRCFYLDANGNEQITQFGKEFWWVTTMDSFINEVPSLITIQAIEDVRALSINKEQLEEVYKKIPKMERLFRRVAENWLIAQQRNSHFFMKANSKERYQKLVTSIPNFVQRVPQYMIASYLDISPEYLSEIRKLP